jgi:phage-related protein
VNKDRYQNALSGVRPSEQSIERILSMTENKQKHIKKGWIIALAAAIILVCALFTVNAATDGAVFNGELIHGLIVRINNKEMRLEDCAYTVEDTTDKDGNPVVHYSFDLPDGKSVDAYAAEEYTAFGMDAQGAESVQIFGEAQTDPAE